MDISRFKFRVWDKKQGKYVIIADSLYYFMIDRDGKLVALKEEYRECGHDDVVRADEERFVVERCTGLKDKNGNLIYEGDVCFCKTPGQKPRYIVFIYNAKYSQMQFRPLNNKQKTDVFSFSEQSPSGAFPFEWLEITGNIHTATEKDGE